ncbi:uncharacterized protein Z520_01808 [Fonsecaea multimorphosa CBS 102226]|uniref:FAD/NAD(P)-binding domain-containing protein n=1 Tax=Fonsecaea multimorphosa CBS 102226 TaxID=1442371 RepID=A0A0D2HIC5_9EURO|nr:uncharacterized protein Z520_01808 [Fonsecaea multimorphosa CBS 102226]KIY01671.1 hypothetical protein Z520_01808 [Fonsecaea multimorphosa CBS 102226]OAL29866.1 hypothetical protein AYO22_01772 [Fonsecaea multimorphosa]
MGSIAPEKCYKVLIVGAGFSGLYMLNSLRKSGYSVRLLEAGAKAGGVWYWNSYPGARVDLEVPQYQFTAEETWKRWDWKQRYPSRDELVAYFEHITKVWALCGDIDFNTRVESARWDKDTSQWRIVAQAGEQQFYRSKFLCLCTGFAAKPFVPPYPGLDSFKGTILHTSHWPQEKVDLTNKRVGIVGTGASGVQAIQEIGKVAAHLTVFQRTPNNAIPIRNPTLDREQNQNLRDRFVELRKSQLTTFGGFLYDFVPGKTTDLSDAERLGFYEKLWGGGGLQFQLGNYTDMMFDPAANALAYQFWREKTLPRIKDGKKAEILAPKNPIHPFGTKRISLEHDYFETFNRPNVDLVNLLENPIAQMTPEGVQTADGVTRELDTLVMATGFDAITGGITQIDLRGASGQRITDKWHDGVYTYLGMTVHDFPNMFIVYGPQAPTAFSAGPVSVEFQGDWIVDCLNYMKQNDLTVINATAEAEREWKAHVNDIGGRGLFDQAQSWYFGANIPGKPREALLYMAGLPAYSEKCLNSSRHGYKGFEIK